MVKYLNSNFVDLMYIFDELSVGFYLKDVYKLNNFLKKLCDKGNIIIVVEYDLDVIKIVDYIVDVGLKVGKYGGEVVYEGSYENLFISGILIGNVLSKFFFIKESVREYSGYLEVKNCNKNNLKNVLIKIFKGVLILVIGVVGVGKSMLIKDEFLK